MGNKKPYVLGITLLLVVVPLVLTMVPFQNGADPLSDIELPKPAISWDLGSYYNYTGPKISASSISSQAFPRVLIDDEDPSYNWSAWAVYPWLTGSGTEEDPYIIEKLLIDAQNDGGCLFILNSNKSFIIRQCYFANTGKKEYDVAIFTDFVENGQIYGNIIHHARTGLYLHFHCANVHVHRNFLLGSKAFGFMRAFVLGWGTHDCSITQNIGQNYGQIAYIFNANNCTMDGNFMNNTEYEEYTCEVITVLSTTGLKFRYNIFTDNYKWFDFGISEVECVNNTISGNSIINSLSGITVPTPLCVNPLIRAAQGSISFMSLGSTSNSQVVNNYIYSPGLIPGFDPMLILSMMGGVGVVLVMVTQRKRLMPRKM